MRSFLLFILISLLSLSISGHTNEISILLSSGLFSYAGSGATGLSNAYFGNGQNLIFNPYGGSSGFSYGFGIQSQRITKSKTIIGLQVSYESLSSKVQFNCLNGYSNLSDQFLNFHPYWGKRIKLIKGISSDMTLGTDLGICISSKEYIRYATVDGNTNSETLNVNKKTTLDIRPRFEFTNYYKKIGLSIGYSYGITNYNSGSSGSNQQVYSRMIRIGLDYSL